MLNRFNNLLLSRYLTSLPVIALIVFPLLVFAGKVKSVKHVKHKHWTKKYDFHFKKYSKHYFGVNYPWYWFKAQSIAESGLNYKAKSKKGAIGLMQILPSTYGDIIKKNPKLGDIKHPKWNIAGGIFYDRQIYRKWKKRQIPASERLAFTFASYNAGYSKILRAYNKKNKNSDKKIQTWTEVKKLTPGATRAYVHRINTLMDY